MIEEIQAGPSGDPAKSVVHSKRFPEEEIPLQPEIGMGSGKRRAVLSRCLLASGWTAIIDDRAARKCALSFSIRHKGTLAVVILARKQGLISSAAEVMHALQVSGLRLDDSVIRIALQKTVGEDW